MNTTALRRVNCHFVDGKLEIIQALPDEVIARDILLNLRDTIMRNNRDIIKDGIATKEELVDYIDTLHKASNICTIFTSY